MKTKVLSLILVLMLVFAFAAPASAFEDYGLVYDDTGLFDQTFMQTMADETLQSIIDTYQFEARVDIVQTLEGDTIEEYAEWFRDNYGYGVNGNGLLLMILVHTDDTGVAFDDYILYPYGTGATIFTGDVMAELDAAVAASLSAEAFGGEMAQDELVMEAALSSFAGLSSAALVGQDVAVAAPVEESEDAEVMEISEAAGFTCVPCDPPSRCVEDHAGILTEDEVAELDEMAKAASAKYGMGIYIVVLNDYTTYNMDSIYETATFWYEQNMLGLGAEDDGILLMLSMAERDYSLIVYGPSANYAFCDYAKDLLSDYFLDNFGDDDWFNGFYEYITVSEEYIAMAAAGTPMNEENDPAAATASLLLIIGFGVIVPLIIGLVVCLIFRAQMKPVKKQTAADNYIVGSVQYTNRSSHFSHVTETRTPLPKDDDSSYDSGGGFSGKSGKF